MDRHNFDALFLYYCLHIALWVDGGLRFTVVVLDIVESWPWKEMLVASQLLLLKEIFLYLDNCPHYMLIVFIWVCWAPIHRSLSNLCLICLIPKWHTWMPALFLGCDQIVGKLYVVTSLAGGLDVILYWCWFSYSSCQANVYLEISKALSMVVLFEYCHYPREPCNDRGFPWGVYVLFFDWNWFFVSILDDCFLACEYPHWGIAFWTKIVTYHVISTFW